MKISTKSYSVFILIIVTMLSCVNSQKKVSLQKTDEIEFVEIRRLNLDINFPEITILRSTEEVRNLYKSLNDSQFSRSAPIPVLEENESLVVLNPKLKSLKYGDLKILKLEEKNGKMILMYDEIENWEYSEKKQTNPVLIIKIFQKPKSVTVKYLKM